MDGETCSGCRFWIDSSADDADSGDEDMRQCRRLPPSPNWAEAMAVVLNLRDLLRGDYGHSEDTQRPYDSLKTDDGRRALRHDLFQQEWSGTWPTTFDHDWCGEWSPRKPLPVVGT